MAVKTFSLVSEGAELLSPHFRVREFACKDGSDLIYIDTLLVYYLQKIREHFGRPVRIHSAYRTPAYNKKVGGAQESQHVLGKAADIKIDGIEPKRIYDYAHSIGVGGLGLYPTFVHIDCRVGRARWNG